MQLQSIITLVESDELPLDLPALNAYHHKVDQYVSTLENPEEVGYFQNILSRIEERQLEAIEVENITRKKC